VHPHKDSSMPDPIPAPRRGETITIGLRGDFAPYDFVLPAPPRPSVTPAAVRMPAPPGYRALLVRIARRLTRVLPGPEPQPRSLPSPDDLATLLDTQVRLHLPIDATPTVEQALRVLGRHAVRERIVRAAVSPTGDAMLRESAPTGLRRLSDIPALRLRPGCRLVPASKCIYPGLPLSPHDAERERVFLAWAEEDAAVQALGRTGRRHRFVRLTCGDGGPRYAMPDFLVRTPAATYLVDVHARRDPPRRLHAVMDWCEWVNTLPPARRGGQAWFFAPLAGLPLEDWYRHGGRLGELLAFARVRAGYVAGFGRAS
jgi:type III restriction enzyme